MVLAINNSGTVELAVVNIAGGNNLDETTLISTTAEGGAGAADSNNVIYSTTARSNVAFRVVGAIISTQSTAGTWATAPSTIQGTGGQAFTSLQSIGYGQTWQTFTVGTQRISGTTYYNTTAKPICVVVTIGGGTAAFVIDAVSIVPSTSNTQVPMTFIIPTGSTYSCTNASIQFWRELR